MLSLILPIVFSWIFLTPCPSLAVPVGYTETVTEHTLSTDRVVITVGTCTPTGWSFVTVGR